MGLFTEEDISPERTFSKMELAAGIVAQFELDIKGMHGLSHWKKVLKLGLYLVDCHWTIPSNLRSCGKELIGYFAFLHDSKRENDGRDPEHGLRAAKYARELHKKGLLHLWEGQLEDLCFALQHHSNPKSKSDDPFIQICWDADRLDLWRVGITPDEKYLHTDVAKEVLKQMENGPIEIEMK